MRSPPAPVARSDHPSTTSIVLRAGSDSVVPQGTYTIGAGLFGEAEVHAGVRGTADVTVTGIVRSIEIVEYRL